MFEIFLIEGQDYGGFPEWNSCCLCVAANRLFAGMLQNIWDAGLLTGGVSMQRAPMSTTLHPTPDALRPAAPQPCSSVNSLSTLFPLKAPPKHRRGPVSAAAGEENSKERAQSSRLLSLLTWLPLHVCVCHPCKERTQGLKITSSGKHHQAGEQSPAPLFMRRGCESMQAL